MEGRATVMLTQYMRHNCYFNLSNRRIDLVSNKVWQAPPSQEFLNEEQGLCWYSKLHIVAKFRLRIPPNTKQSLISRQLSGSFTTPNLYDCQSFAYWPDTLRTIENETTPFELSPIRDATLSQIIHCGLHSRRHSPEEYCGDQSKCFFWCNWKLLPWQ